MPGRVANAQKRVVVVVGRFDQVAVVAEIGTEPSGVHDRDDAHDHGVLRRAGTSESTDGLLGARVVGEVEDDASRAFTALGRV